MPYVPPVKCSTEMDIHSRDRRTTGRMDVLQEQHSAGESSQVRLYSAPLYPTPAPPPGADQEQRSVGWSVGRSVFLTPRVGTSCTPSRWPERTQVQRSAGQVQVLGAVGGTGSARTAEVEGFCKRIYAVAHVPVSGGSSRQDKARLPMTETPHRSVSLGGRCVQKPTQPSNRAPLQVRRQR